jgi:acetyl-CoA C-acetyltransferase
LNATPQCKLVEDYDGAGTLESFVVMHERDGSPAMCTVAVQVGEGTRTWATTTDADTISWLESGDPVVGTPVSVKERVVTR